MGLEDSFKAFSGQVKLLKTLTKSIPQQALRCATKNDRVTQVFDNIKIPDNDDERWEVFNKRMDALFGEDVRDGKTGRLLNVLRGEHGMDLVLRYFDAELKAGALPWDLAKIKVNRLIDEVMAIKQSYEQNKNKTSVATVSNDDDTDDADYHPPKRQREEPGSPSRIFDSEGEEIEEENDRAVEIREKRARKKARTLSLSTDEDSPAVEKPTEKPLAKKKKLAHLDDIESGEESDGQSAKRLVDEQEKSKGARRGPENKSLDGFYSPVPVLVSQKPRWQFKCKQCECVRTVERTLKGKDAAFSNEPVLPKLSNLASHLATCKGKDVASSMDGEDTTTAKPLQFNHQRSLDIMAGYLHAGKLNPAIEPDQEGFYRLFSAWVLDESLPWTTGEAPALSLLFKYARIHFKTPSDTTVRTYLSKIYQELHGKVVQEIAALKSKIAYATDTWTTRQMVYSFACSIAAWIDDDWNLVTRVVDFKALKDKEHEGECGGLAFVNGVRQRGGLEKMSASKLNYIISSPYLDNASVNDTLVETVSKTLLERYGVPYTPDCHIRCFAHIVNLVVQSFLASMDEAPDPDDDDQYADISDYPLHYNVDEDEEQIALESERFEKSVLNVLEGDLEETVDHDEVRKMSALKRLRFITQKITSSPQRRLRFRKIAKAKYAGSSDPEIVALAILMVIKDIRTRWNYTLAMIQRALLLREAIDSWVFETAEFRDALLSDEDWKFLKMASQSLEIFSEVTLQMSMESVPTLPFVLPLYLSMETKLKSYAIRPDNEPQDTRVPWRIRAAANAALEKLYKYKKPAESNQFYTIATVLHPFLRSMWFQKTETSPPEQKAAIKKAETLFKAVARAYHEDEPEISIITPSTPSTIPSVSSKKASSALADACDFALPSSVAAAKKTADEHKAEVDRYLKFEGGKGTLEDPLAWWKTHEASFPTLSRMAKDFLAIPATSVAVERVFSKSRHICSDLRSSLKAETISEALLSKMWIRSGLLDVNKPRKPFKKGGM